MTIYTTTQRAYGVEPGATIDLDGDDPLVRLNVDAGVLVEGKAAAAAADARMTCPVCSESMKRPPRFTSAEEVATHYTEKHPAFAAPAWAADTTEGSEK